MKTKRDQYKKERGRMLFALLAFVLAFGLAVAAPSLDGPALAADPAGPAGEPAGGPNSEPANGPLQQNGGSGGGQDAGTSPAAGQGGDPAPQPAVSGAALDLDALKGSCSLTLEFPKKGSNVIGSTTETLANPDPAQVKIWVDVYKIADAVKKPGYQTYQFSISDQNKALYDAIDKLLVNDPNTGWYRADNAGSGTINFYYAPDPNKEDLHGWSEFVDALARVCLLESNTITPVQGEFGQPITGLDPGLYLTVVHGEIPQNGLILDDGDQYKDEGTAPSFAYPEYITAQMLTGANARLERYADGTICTDLAGTAYDEKYVYLFQPQLVSLPGYTVDEQVPDAVPNNTAENGTWQPAVTMVTKHEAEPRYVDLQIVKQLPKYLAGQDSVTFIYQIDYTDEKGAARSMTQAISFTGPSKDGKETRVIVDRIPLTSKEITVTEIYTGYTYQFASVAARAALNRTGTGQEHASLGAADTTTHSITIPAADLQPGSIQLTVPDAPAQNAQNPTAHTVRLDDGVTHIVAFSNTLDDTTKGGGSVVNSFAGDAKGKWTWTKRAYDPASKTWKDVTDGNWSQPVETQPPAGGN